MQCNGNCSERCTVNPKIRKREVRNQRGCATEGKGERKRETSSWICHLQLPVAGNVFVYALVRCAAFVLPDKIAADSLSDRMLAGRSPTTSQTGPDLFAYVPDVQLPGRLQSLAFVPLRLRSPPGRCWVCATCNWHNRNGKRLATRHKLARQHNKLSCRIFLPCNRAEIEVWNLVKSASVSDSAGLPQPVILFFFFQLYFWLFDRQTGRRQIMPGQNPKQGEKKR